MEINDLAKLKNLIATTHGNFGLNHVEMQALTNPNTLPYHAPKRAVLRMSDIQNIMAACLKEKLEFSFKVERLY